MIEKGDVEKVMRKIIKLPFVETSFSLSIYKRKSFIFIVILK